MEKPGVPRRLTAAGVKQRRMAGVKNGRRAEVVTDAEITRYRLQKIDPDAPELIEKFARGIGGDISALDGLLAGGMASKEIIRRKMVEEIAARGVVIEERLLNSEGQEVGRRVRPNPMLESLKHADEQLGYTAEAARLTRKSRGQGARDDAIAEATKRDARLRASDKSRLPPADLEILRQTPEEAARTEAYMAERSKDPVYQARLAAEAIRLGQDPESVEPPE